MIIPSHLQIETVAGICSASCIMCPIEQSPRHGIMSNLEFEQILQACDSIKENLKFTSLFGLGEPLLDRQIAEKVKIAKRMGFPSVGFATNATNLSESLSLDLLQSGLDTIIFSIDSMHKEVHERIRPKTNFEIIRNNVLNFIKLRNEYGDTKIIVRMVRQELNSTEWHEYEEFWLSKINKRFSDKVSCIDVHNWGGDGAKGYTENVTDKIFKLSSQKPLICTEIYEKIFVQLNGNVALCCADEMGWFNLGNVFKQSPKEIYNSGKFIEYRDAMKSGHIGQLDHCKNCSMVLAKEK